MPERNYTKLGAFLVLGFCLIVAAGVFYGYQNRQRDHIMFVTYLDEPVPGLGPSSVVRFRGVEIGQVEQISIAPEDMLVEVQFSVFVDSVMKLGHTDAATAKARIQEGLEPDSPLRIKQVANPITGQSFLQIDRLDEPPPAMELNFTPPHPVMPSMPSIGAALSNSLQATLATLPDLVEKLDTLVDNVNQSVVDANVKGLSQRTANLLDSIEEEIAQVGEELQRLLDDQGPVEGLLVSARTEVERAELGATLARLRTSLDRVVLLTEDVRDLSPDARALLRQIQGLLRMLNEEPESLLFGPRPQEDQE